MPLSIIARAYSYLTLVHGRTLLNIVERSSFYQLSSIGCEWRNRRGSVPVNIYSSSVLPIQSYPSWLDHETFTTDSQFTDRHCRCHLAPNLRSEDRLDRIIACETETTELTTVATTMAPVPEPVNYRLPASVRPELYNLILNPDLITGLFAGTVVISVNVFENTKQVVLHSSGLVVKADNVHVTSVEDAVKVPVHYIEIDVSSKEFLTINLEQALQMNCSYKITIEFEGDLKNKIVGFYKSEYANEHDELRKIATSKFEPTYARMSFPCFDEPNMKAKFSVKLVKPLDPAYSALSNMNVQSEEATSATEKTVTFYESVPMSTYLVAFIVSDFGYTEKIVKPPPNLGDDIKLRVYSTPAQVEKTQLALDTGAKITEFYINFFQIPYPLPKLDFAAIPDFSSGAMETWGLVTFRETALLFDENIGSVNNKQRVASVVAHELAHMWFGNLVTMDWWNELWLNEGFANYIQYLGCDNAFPEWSMVDQFLISELHSAFYVDAKLSSHPIVQTVTNPDEITAIFDTISYSKGASVLRMLSNFVGMQDFQQGIRDYLNKHKYKNAKSVDLFNALQLVVKDRVDITAVMDTWTRQMGYPEVKVTQIGKGKFKLTQSRFLIDPEVNASHITPSEYGYKWMIPITYITSTNQTQTLKWLNPSDSQLEITTEENIAWIKFNVNQMGYYKVNYDEQIWQQLIDNYMSFSISDKTSLVSDAFTLAEAGRLKYSIPLSLSEQFKDEKDYVPWTVVSSELKQMRRLLINTEVYSDLTQFVPSIVKNILNELNWNVGANEPHLNRLLRIIILSLACTFGDNACLSRAGGELQKWLDNINDRPHQDIRSIVYKYGMMSDGTVKEWDIMWARYLAEIDAQEKDVLRAGLASIREPWVLSRYIERAWNTSNVRRQDYFSCLIQISDNSVGTGIVWDHVRANWPQLVKEFGLNDRYLGRLIPSITSSFATEFKLNEMREFFAKYPEAGAGTTARAQAIETVQNNIKWLKLYKQDVAEWLQNRT